MEITDENYRVSFDETNGVVTCQGSFRLRGAEEYQPILDLLISAADATPELLTVDVRELQFLNSSGINTLSKFVLQVRKHNASQVVIRGNPSVPWQTKSLKNFQRLLPGLRLEID